MRVKFVPQVEVNLNHSNPAPKRKNRGGKNFKELLIKCLTEEDESVTVIPDKNTNKESK